MPALSISYKGEKKNVDFDDTTAIGELIKHIELETGITKNFIKLIAPGKGLLKGENLNPEDKISQVFSSEASRSKITLVGTPQENIQKLNDAETAKAIEHQKRLQRYQYQRRNQKKAAVTTSASGLVDSRYTFGKLVPLPMFRDADKSLAILQRLRDDRGVQEVMKKYKMYVGVLTELDPATNTTHEKRCLGLNENRGQIIRLRLRTDDYQGWCSYKEIRNVLCHELTHNYFGDHDRQFWDMCNKLEKEVVSLDPFGAAGHMVGGDVYRPGTSSVREEEEQCDEGGWIGTTQVLGTAGGSNGKPGSSSDNRETVRERMLKAAQSGLNKSSPEADQQGRERESPPSA